MKVRMRTAGLVVEVDAEGAWASLVVEAGAGQLLPAQGEESADVRVRVLGGHARPHVAGLQTLTRSAWSDGARVVLEDACASGLDLQLVPRPDHLEVVATPRPSWRHRLLGLAAPDRRILLARAVLLQYPALWWAGLRGHVPLHASAASVDGLGLVLAGPGGVGKSTLMATVEPAGGHAVSDNVCVTDARSVHGLLEPARRDDAGGRRMPHGRRECPWRLLDPSLVPTAVVVLRRGQGPAAHVRRIGAEEAARELVGGTYVAGELRRYWSFAATLGLGTGLGLVHPPVAAVCEELVARTRTFELLLPPTPTTGVAQVAALLRGVEGGGSAPVTETMEVGQS